MCDPAARSITKNYYKFEVAHMDSAAQQSEKLPYTEIPEDKFALFECKFTRMTKEEIVKQGLGFYWDKSGLMGFEIDGNIIRPEPIKSVGAQPRYVMAGVPSDIDSKIHGGMGTVRKMRDTKIGRIVAAKRVGYSKNAILEGRMLAQFAHPNIVTIYDLAVTDPNDARYREVYFISEWLNGKTLDTWNKQSHSLKEVASVVDQIAAGINHINSLGYVYGDLKPLNIMFDHFGTIKIVDAGLSFKMDADGKGHGYGFATYNYAPREQTDGILSLKTDEYSLAAVVFELLTDFRGLDGHEEREKLIKLPNSEISFKKEYDEKLSIKQKHEFSEIMRKALQLNPDERYPSIVELNDEVQKLLSHIQRK